MHEGTTTAGETAPIMKPRAKERGQERSNISLADNAIDVASNTWGQTVTLNKAALYVFILLRSKPRPARRRITVIASCLIVSDHSAYSYPTTLSTIFLAKIPIIIIPNYLKFTSGGNVILVQHGLILNKGKPLLNT